MSVQKKLLLVLVFLLSCVETAHAVQAKKADSKSNKPDSVLILVHGVWSNQRVFGKFEKQVAEKQLPGAWVVKFEWGEELPFRASDSIGARPNSVFGMSDEAFVAAAKLKEVVGRCRELVGDEVPINLLTHSQGSVIALSCLQEGLKVDNWILMGSPLDKEGVTSGEENTSLGRAAANVSGKVVNLWSEEDGVAWIKGGIGRFGLPKKIHGISEKLANGSVANILDVSVEKVDHFDDTSWWTVEWLAPEDMRKWIGPVNKVQFLSLLKGSANKPVAQSQAFTAIKKFAAEGTRKTSWAKIFGDGDENEFTHVFTLTEGTMNGIYFDDKDFAEYDIECISGNCSWQIKSATNSSWDKVEDEKTLKTGATVKGNFKVKFRDTLIKQDATIFLSVTNTSNGIAKIRCRLKAKDL